MGITQQYKCILQAVFIDLLSRFYIIRSFALSELAVQVALTVFELTMKQSAMQHKNVLCYD